MSISCIQQSVAGNGAPDLVRAARLRLERFPRRSDNFELNRLRVRTDVLEGKIFKAVNGEKIRFQFQRSECLKAIAQLTLGKMETVIGGVP